MGMPSRILGAKFGATWTYGAFNKERGIAPGLPSYQELKQVYGYPRINADTLVFGVVGDPIGHSLSPLIHNQAFRDLGLNAVYVPFRVPRTEFKTFLEEFKSLPVQGYSITIPHKEAAGMLARTRDPEVDQIQACNTLIHGSKGFHAYNTDYLGFLESLRHNLPRAIGEGFSTADGNSDQGIMVKPNSFVQSLPQPSSAVRLLENRTVLILGAGGIARAVTYAVVSEGGLATIVNRTPERAQRLAEEFNCRQVDWNARHNVLADLVINCTSVGMHPDMDASPLHQSYLKPGLTVFDTVYTPEQTLLVKEARSRGCHVITGVDLFVRQAALQFHLFTGQPAPTAIMQELIKRFLSPVALKPASPPPSPARGD